MYDAIKLFRDLRALHERPAADFAENRLGSACSVRQEHPFIAGVPGPFINVLKKMPVNGFQVRGIEVPGWALPKLNLQKPTHNPFRLGGLKIFIIGLTEFVFERQPVGKRVAGQA